MTIGWVVLVDPDPLADPASIDLRMNSEIGTGLPGSAQIAGHSGCLLDPAVAPGLLAREEECQTSKSPVYPTRNLPPAFFDQPIAAADLSFRLLIAVDLVCSADPVVDRSFDRLTSVGPAGSVARLLVAAVAFPVLRVAS